jgi:hypothetical protein
MEHKIVSRDLSKNHDKNLSKWNEAILEAKRKIAALRRSIRFFEEMRDKGKEFPEPKTVNRKIQS